MPKRKKEGDAADTPNALRQNGRRQGEKPHRQPANKKPRGGYEGSRHNQAPADAAEVPVVSQPLPEDEDAAAAEHTHNSDAAGSPTAMQRSPSGRLASRRRPREAAPPHATEDAALDAGITRPRRATRRAENGINDGSAEPASPSRWHQPEGAAEADIGSERDISRLGESVVKVFCVHSEPNFSLPWTRKRQYSSTGSGFILPDRRILTNAHCVDHHSQVKVRRRGSDIKFVATVLAIGTECDIAMLTVADDRFWENVEPVRFGQLPHLQDPILVIGYPIGGDSQSVTSGVVSRIEVTSYVHGSTELLGMQIDAAINSGNSGGPAFNSSGECVGIAFQSLKNEDAENIGYVIPPPVIHHFLRDFAANGKYTGFPALGIEWQKLEWKSKSLRKALGMENGLKGVLVRRVEPTAPTSKVLRKGDILLKFDDTEIGYDGTVAFRSGERINFSYLISEKQNNDDAVLTILRDGKRSEVKLRLRGPHRMIPSHIKGAAPSYFIFAGLVFTPVTVPYLKSEYGKEFEFDAPVKLLDKLLHAMADKPTQQIVVVGQVLAADVNIGFEEIVNTQVLRINKQPVSNLQEVVAAVEGCKEEFIRFDLDYDTTVILDMEEGRQTTQQILDGHGISHDRSVDLRAAAAAG